MKLILGSTSKSRQQLLNKAGFKFGVLAPNIDEKQIRDANPRQLPLAVARAKARALFPKIDKPALLITADQVVYCQDEIFEKPCDEIELRKFLLAYSQHPAQTMTAVVVTNTQTKESVEGVDVATIYFSPTLIDSVENYLSNKKLYQCSGGFQVEDEGEKLNPYITKVDGEIDSVKGLPMKLLKNLLNKMKYTIEE